MARMIPPECAESTISAAEKRIFNLLKHDPSTSDWVVLHSLGLTTRGQGAYGEIDFVVLIPNGTIICIEVKGGRVFCSDGIWHTTDRWGQTYELKKSPFMQARDGMFALRNAVLKKFGREHAASQCIFEYAVIFPDVSAPPVTTEFESWEAISRDDLRSPISQSIRRITTRSKHSYRLPQADLAAEAIREIRKFFRPDFERIVACSTVISRTESAIVALSEDQYQILDMLSENRNCLIEGAAGTGKTVLALEYARRAVREKRRTLFLCYNRLLGDWLSSQNENICSPLIVAGSFYRIARGVILKSSYREEFLKSEQESRPERIFSELLPWFGQLAADELGEQYDTLVLDEAQDLISTEHLDFLDLLLKGGIAGGNWCFFGDFTQQAIYGRGTREDRLQCVENRCSRIAFSRLLTNCRNTRRIGEETALLSGFASIPYRLGQIDGLPVDYRYWKTPEEQAKLLSSTIERLLKEGILPQDITVLSPHRYDESIAFKMSDFSSRLGPVKIKDLRTKQKPETFNIGFTTIHAFKGMESACVVLCDIEQIETGAPQALLYTAMSRARSYLAVLVSESAKEGISKALIKKLSREWQK